MVAVCEHGTPRVDDPHRLAGVEALGWDETAFQAASARRSTSFVTGIVDLTRGFGPARLLAVVEDRSASALVGWMNQRDPGWRAGIGVAALDPYRGYATALRIALPGAIRVLDAFPVVRLGFAAVDEVRRRIQREHTGHRGAVTTRSMASAGCCAAPPTTTPTAPGYGCWPDSTPGTPTTSSSPAPGSPPRTSG
ncbi:MAG: transposase [Actinomycetota bacterium]|nr:transposase [Actinomycetota bacterium]